MTVEIRACRDREELEQYGRVVGYVFASSDGLAQEVDNTLPEWTLCAWVDGKLATSFATLPFLVQLNGAPVPMGGVTAVGTLPEFRRRGLLREVMRQALGNMRDAGQPFAILWASMGAIYQRFGYGRASRYVRYKFDPRFVQFAERREVEGSVGLVPRDEAFPIIEELYNRWIQPRNLLIHRVPQLWEVSTLRGKPDEALYIAICRDGKGEPQGHIVYKTKEVQRTEPGPNHEMEVRDFVALNMDAYRLMWEYIRAHDLVGTVNIAGCVPEDDPAPDLLLEPRMLNRWTGDGIWMRVTDVEGGVAKRRYDLPGRLVFGIEGDDLCPWNNGAYELEADGESASVRRVEREPGIVMAPAALSSLVSGYAKASHLARLGLVDVRDEKALAQADLLFATAYRPHCANDF